MPLQVRFMYSTWGGAGLEDEPSSGEESAWGSSGDDEGVFLLLMVPNLMWGIGHESRNRTQAGF
jgi:hypothetical protein